MGLVLVLGGIRSGKSAVAEQLAAEPGAPVCYVATADGADPELRERIDRHRARRPATWRTVERASPDGLAPAPGETVLLDGLAPWLAALLRGHGLWTEKAVAPLGQAGRAAFDRAVAQLRAWAEHAAARGGRTVVVAEESGLGLLPLGAGTRRYLDLAGEATQALAAAAERVVLVVAGRPLELPPANPTRGRGDREGGGQAGGEGELLRLHGDSMVPEGHLDFAVNVVPGAPPAWLRRELSAALDQAAAYPREEAAVAALARRHGRPAAGVLPTNGSAEAFWLLASALPPGDAAVVHPSFTEPEAALRAAGHRVRRVFRDPETFALRPGSVPDDASLVVVGNPNNPTGTLETADALAALARPGRVLLLDEAFIELAGREDASLAARADLPGLVVVRSLTKLWGLAGIRVGYLLAEPGLAGLLRARRPPWSVNRLACAALAACAADGETAALVAAEVAAARAALADGLARLPGVRVWPGAANFLLLRVPDGASVRRGLAERRIAVRRCDTFPGLGADHLRVAVRRPPENQRLLAALAEVLGPPGAAGPSHAGATAPLHEPPGPATAGPAGGSSPPWEG